MADDPYDGLSSEYDRLRDSEFDALPSRLKAAKWLIESIGVGNTFRITQLKGAFPKISQIDRRMRDLKPAGWLIDTNQDNPNLATDAHHFRSPGSLKPAKTVSNRTRR